MRAWSCKMSLKKTRVKLDFSTDIDMLLMAEKGIKEGIWCWISWKIT